MIFTSIKGYFYKLYNICYVLVLTPLALFLFLYYEAQVEKILPIIQEEYILLVGFVLFIFVVVGLTTVHLYLRNRLGNISKAAGLGDKMDRYFPLALIRISVGSMAAFLMNVGFYLTSSFWFAVAFGGIMVWIGWLWPTPKRFCDDLSVRNDERELMLKSKDAF